MKMEDHNPLANLGAGRGDHDIDSIRRELDGSDANSILVEIGRIITASPDIDAVYARFAELLKPLIPFDRIDIILIDWEFSELCAEFSYGVEFDGPWGKHGATRPLAGSITEQVVAQQSGILFTPSDDIDVEKDYPQHVPTHRLGIRSSLSVPLVSSGAVIGILAIMSTKSSAYDNNALRLAEEVALQISGAVVNSRLLAKQVEAHEELAESEARYRTLIENMDARVTLKGSDGRYRIANQNFINYVSHPKGVIGKTTEELSPDHQGVRDAENRDAEVFRTGNTVRYEEVQSSNDDSRTFLTWKAPVRDSGEQVSGIVTVSTDVTDERNSREEARRLAREGELLAEIGQTVSSAPVLGKVFKDLYDLLESLFPLDAAGMNLLDPDGRVKMLDMHADDVVIPWEQGVAYETEGTFTRDLIVEGHAKYSSSASRAGWALQYPESTDSFDAGFKSLIGAPLFSNGKPFGTLILSSHSVDAYDDTHLDLIERVAAQISGPIANAQLYTERVEAEAELRSVHDQYRLLVDSLEEAVCMKEASGRIVLVNQAFADQMGLSKAEIEGRVREELYPDSGWTEAARNRHEHILRTGIAIEHEFTDDLGTGPKTHRVRHIPVPDSQGNIHHIVSSSSDITEQQGLQNQLLQSQKMEAVGRLAGGVAHDFNNLLTAILGYAELGRRAQPGENRAARVFREISQVAERAATLTKQLLTFSRSQTGNAVLVDLNELVMDLDSMLRRLIGADIELVTLTAPGPLMIRVDPGQLEQVLTNLVVNARDAMVDGGKLSIETSDAGLGNALLSVSDTGAGMTDEVRQHIFEPFYTTKGVGEGSGLGLSTSYGIVTQSGGAIDVISELGQGSSFRVVLPIAEGDPKLSNPSDRGTRTGGNETILLVEDEPAIRSMISAALRELGYKVLEAPNGIDAISVAESRPNGDIHLLLTDLVMPMLGGKETASRVSQRLPGIKVLFTSGFHGDVLDDINDRRPEGQFLTKPFTLEALASKVREALDGSNGPDQRPSLAAIHSETAVPIILDTALSDLDGLGALIV
jgi:two-component system, cell cycle sensor histidine kinase and response regulator CckA